MLRSADILGPGFTEGYDYIVSRIAEGRMVIPGNGENIIQWVHVTDLVEALLLAKEKGKPGEIYIITRKEVRTLNECLALLVKYLGVASPSKSIPKTLAITAANYWLFKTRVSKEKPLAIKEYLEKLTANRSFDISKAKTELGFEPVVDYEDVAKELVVEYMKD